MYRTVLALLAAVFGMLAMPVVAGACPFCEGIKSTLAMENAEFDAVAIGRLVKAPQADPKRDGLQFATFEITHVLKGTEYLPGWAAEGAAAFKASGNAKPKTLVEAPLYSNVEMGTQFLLRGIVEEKRTNVDWSTPIQLAERGVQYMLASAGLPPKGGARLKFFLSYLLDEDKVLAHDAYAEFAIAPYSELVEMRGDLDPDQLLALIKDLQTSDRRRRLYLTMLGVCGRREHADLLEPMLVGYPPHPRSDLDALAACYLVLRKEEGLPLLKNWFLANPCADPSELYAVTAAIRFHGDDAKVIERTTLAEALHPLLATPEDAERVLPDLARWEDWSVVDSVIDLVRHTGSQHSYTRELAVQFLLACPSAEGQGEITRLEESEPALVHRARLAVDGIGHGKEFGGAPVPPPSLEEEPPAATVPAASGAMPISAANKSPIASPQQPGEWRTALVVACLVLGMAILYFGLRRRPERVTTTSREEKVR